MDFRNSCSILYKYIKFELHLEWLHFLSFFSSPWELLTWFLDSGTSIFEFFGPFYISIPNFNLIWNGSIFTVFGSLRALYLISRFWDLDFWILWSILYKYTKFHADWTILNFLMTSLPRPKILPHPFRELDFRILRAKLCLWTKFHADWTILNFLMTSWPYPNCHAQRVWALEKGLGLL